MNDCQRGLQALTRRMMATVSELSLYQVGAEGGAGGAEQCGGEAKGWRRVAAHNMGEGEVMSEVHPGAEPLYKGGAGHASSSARLLHPPPTFLSICPHPAAPGPLHQVQGGEGGAASRGGGGAAERGGGAAAHR